MGSLLVTPTANLASNGGSQHPAKRKAGGHGPTLDDQVSHLRLMPTPTGRDSKGIDGHSKRQGSQVLPGVVEALLPTPRATRGGSATETVGKLLPTPSANQFEVDPERWQERRRQLMADPDVRNGNGFGLTTAMAVSVLWDGLEIDWAEYRPAIERWSALFGPVMCPVEEGRTRPRLAPEFAEWMMGLPGGWVTRVPGLPRTGQLRAIGNGVVPQQMALGIRICLMRMLEGDA